MAQTTKKAIAASLKRLLEQKPLTKITVTDIAKDCNISRHTFYYHFRDKYEVVSWIFYDEIRPFLAQFDRLENWTAGLSELCLYLQANREFYIPMLEVQGQNSFCECLTQFYQDLIYALLLKQGAHALQERQMQTVSRFIAAGIVSEIRRWGHRGMKSDPAPAIQMLRELFSGQLLNELHRMHQPQ